MYPPGPKHFTAGPGPVIRAVDAVAALLVLPGWRYVMQIRDDRPDIIYPGHYACFGGAVQPGEAPLDALKRELLEELELRLGAATQFASFDFELSGSEGGRFFRMYFEVALEEQQLRRLRQHEGSGLKVFEAEELIHAPWVAPHDSFAIWLHRARERVAVAPSAGRGA